MKIRVSINLGLYGVHHVLFDQGEDTGLVGSPVQGTITKIELTNQLTNAIAATPPEKAKADIDRLRLIDLHLTAFRPHLDSSIKSIELNLLGTKPTSLHSRATNLRQLEDLDALVDESKGEPSRPIIDIDGHRFRREEIWSPTDSVSRRVWYAIAGNGEGGETGENAKPVEPVGGKVDLVALHKIIKEMHPKRDRVELSPSLEKTSLNSDRHKVIPEVIEALEAASLNSYSSDLGETTADVKGVTYRRIRVNGPGGKLAWFAIL